MQPGMQSTSRAPRVFNRWGRSALRAVSGLACAAAASLATAQVPKVLVIGDVHAAGSYLSQPYANAAYNEMVAAVTALGGSAVDVTQKNFDITGAGGNPTTVTAADFVAPGGGGYDIVVLTAVFGGFNAASVSAVQCSPPFKPALPAHSFCSPINARPARPTSTRSPSPSSMQPPAGEFLQACCSTTARSRPHRAPLCSMDRPHWLLPSVRSIR